VCLGIVNGEKPLPRLVIPLRDYIAYLDILVSLSVQEKIFFSAKYFCYRFMVALN